METGHTKVVVVDENDEVIGAENMMVAKEKGLIRRASRIYVFNESGKLLIQQRSPNIEKPLLLDQSAAGHVDEGETYEEAAYRELKEEIGIDGFTLTLVATSVRTSEFYNTIYKVVVPDDTTIDYDPSEVKTVIWYDIETIEKELQETPERFTPAFRELWPTLGEKIISAQVTPV